MSEKIEVPRISSWESVEAVKTLPSRPNFRKDVNRAGLLKCPRSRAKKVLRRSQFSFGCKFSDRKCEQIGVIEVSRQSNLSRWSEFLNGCVNRFGLLKCRRSQSKKVSRQSKLSFRTAISRGCVKSLGLLKCPRSQARKVSRQSNCPSGANF